MFDIYTHEDVEYASGDSIHGAKILPRNGRNPREMVKNNHITHPNFVFARAVGDKLTITEGKSPKLDRVFIKIEYLLAHVSQYRDYIMRVQATIPKAAAILKNYNVVTGIIEPKPEVKSEPSVTTKSTKRKVYNLPVVMLEDHEKFRSDDGVIHEVECRGEKTPDGIHFKLSDIAVMIDKDPRDLYRRIIGDGDDNYEYDIHYKVITNSSALGEQCSPGTTNVSDPLVLGAESAPNNNESRKSEYYLTFKGVLKVIFASRTGRMNDYVDWITKLVYTAQMGTLEQKQELINELAGADYYTTELLLSGETPVPGIYLFNIDGKKYKFGRTNNILRRFQEHKRKYGDQLKLVTYVRIENYYINDKDVHVLAETKLRELLRELRVKVDGHNELIECDDLNEVLPVFQTIRKEFGKTATEIVQDLKDKLKDAECELRLKDAECKSLTKLHDRELKIKDQAMEIVMLKLKTLNITID